MTLPRYLGLPSSLLFAVLLHSWAYAQQPIVPLKPNTSSS